MIKMIILTLFFTISMSCTSGTIMHKKSSSFSDAEKMFDNFFPRKWPAKKVIEPVSGERLVVLLNMRKEVEKHLETLGASYRVIDDFSLQVLPEGKSTLSKYSTKLAYHNIKLVYNSLYFAKNPFSSGTFIEQKKTMIISHNIMLKKKKMEIVLEHEMVHVRTFLEKQKKQPSIFYCKFKGKMFQPHYLACDEMRAYNSDIDNLIEKNDIASLKSKLKSAKMHVKPVLELIPKLDASTWEVSKNSVKINNLDRKNDFYFEFPVFSIDSAQKMKKAVILNYLNDVVVYAKKMMNKIESIEMKYNI